jgi:uncharacterized protein (DUF433 family)
MDPLTTEDLTAKLALGAYAPPEAARIAHLKTRRVRRWLAGYRFTSPHGVERHSRPVFPREHEGSSLALTFMDLVEVLYVAAFVEAGVSMPVIRLVHAEAEREFGVRHPFAIKRFETDGKSLFHRFVAGDVERLLDRDRAQFVDRVVFDPLMRQLDYDAFTEQASRYWPLGREVPVLIDPTRSFGEAIVTSGVPTRVIFAAHESGDSKLRIARWYAITAEEVDAAIDYELSIARPTRAA